MSRDADADAVTRARLASQLLSGPPATTVEAVVERLLAVQAQDPRGARLAVRPRSSGLRATDVDEALTERRSLVVTWLNRGTLHLVTAEDYWWLHALTAPRLTTANRRRLQQEGVSEADATRGVDLIAAALLNEGPRTRAELRQRLDAARVPTAGQALVHLFLAASLHGHLVRGPVRSGEQAFVAPSAWLGAPPPSLERAEALARLARRYLAGHGPADARDLAKWAGLPLRDARAGLAAVHDELVHGPGDLVDLADRDLANRDLADRDLAGRDLAMPDLPPPRLLGPFDPLLLGWASRARFVGRHRLVTTNGLFRPFALVEGRVVATWSLAANRLRIQLLEPVARQAVEALAGDAVEVHGYLGLPQAQGSPEIVPPAGPHDRTA